MWDLIGDEKRVSVSLPDGTEEKIRLTILQTTLFDEAVRSGVLSASEIVTLSRVSAVIDAYNGAVQRFVSLHSSFQSTPPENVSDELVEVLRDAIYEVENNKYEVFEGTKKVMNVWGWKEAKKALAISGAGDQKGEDSVLLSIANPPKVSPAGYKAGVYEKLEEVKEALVAKDTETACDLLTEIIDESQDLHRLSHGRVPEEEAENLIAEAERLKKEWNCPN